MAVHYCEFSPDDSDGPKELRDTVGPQAVRQAVGRAISRCWALMPADKRNADAVAAEIRRIVERALANLKEDAQVFGFHARR